MEVKISIGNKSYKVKLAETEKEREAGLQGIESLEEDSKRVYMLEKNTLIHNLEALE